MHGFEWDETKRRKNIEKHGIDFYDAPVVFEGLRIEGEAKTVGGEARRLTTGVLDGVYVTVVYTLRNGGVRIIMMRRARDGERRKYQEVFGG